MRTERPYQDMEEWLDLHDFPGYSVSHLGRVRNDISDRTLNIAVNQLGIPYVSLRKMGDQFNRAVAPLVAHAFLPFAELPSFDTPINLDGDRLHCAADNLMWRPRWFAVHYHRQFILRRIGIRAPIEDIDTEERFPNSWEAAIKFGLLDREVMSAVHSQRHVWPTYQRFRMLGNYIN